MPTVIGTFASHNRNMRFTALTDYAIRATIEIAANNQEWVSIDQISQAQSLSDDYLRTALNSLRRAGILESRRGREGGFRLTRPAKNITLGDIIRAIDGPLTSVRGERPESLQYQGTSLGLAKVWIALRASEREILDSVNLLHLTTGKLPAKVERLIQDPLAWLPPK